jgi:hypothetical protein
MIVLLDCVIGRLHLPHERLACALPTNKGRAIRHGHGEPPGPMSSSSYPAVEELELFVPMFGQLCTNVLFVPEAIAVLDAAAVLFVTLVVVLVAEVACACTAVRELSPANVATSAIAMRE